MAFQGVQAEVLGAIKQAMLQVGQHLPGLQSRRLALPQPSQHVLLSQVGVQLSQGIKAPHFLHGSAAVTLVLIALNGEAY